MSRQFEKSGKSFVELGIMLRHLRTERDAMALIVRNTATSEREHELVSLLQSAWARIAELEGPGLAASIPAKITPKRGLPT